MYFTIKKKSFRFFLEFEIKFTYFAHKWTKHSGREIKPIWILFCIKQGIKNILTIKYSVSIGHFIIEGSVS